MKYKIKILVFNTKTQLWNKLSYITNKYIVTNGIISFTDNLTNSEILHPLQNTEIEVVK